MTCGRRRELAIGRNEPAALRLHQLPFLNLLAGAANRRKLLFWWPCEPLPVLAAARVDATATVVLLFATTRRLPRSGTDKQPSDYPARGAIN